MKLSQCKCHLKAQICIQSLSESIHRVTGKNPTLSLGQYQNTGAK